MSVDKFNADYLRLRKMLVRGQVNADEAKLWLKDKQQELTTSMAEHFEANLFRWGKNANRDDQMFNQMFEVGED